MPEVRYVKVFNKIPDYENPNELTDVQGLTTIKADSFPFTATVGLAALIKVEPKFYGTFTLRFPEDTPDYHEIGFENPKNEPLWIAPKYDTVKATFSKPGTYYAALALDGEIIQKTPVVVE